MTQHPTKDEIAALVDFLTPTLGSVNEKTKEMYELALRLEPMREELEKLIPASEQYNAGIFGDDLPHWKIRVGALCRERDNLRLRLEESEAERDALLERVKELSEAIKPLKRFVFTFNQFAQPHHKGDWPTNSSTQVQEISKAAFQAIHDLQTNPTTNKIPLDKSEEL